MTTSATQTVGQVTRHPGRPRKPTTPFELLTQICAKHPTYTSKEHETLYVAEMQENEAFIQVVLEQSFAVTYRSAMEASRPPAERRRVFEQQRAEKAEKVEGVKRTARVIAQRAVKEILSAFDRFKTSDGISWGDVCAHELDSMIREGEMAAAIKRRLPRLSGKNRFAKLRDLLSVEDFAAIMKETSAARR